MTGWRKRTIMEMAQEAEFELDCVSLEWHKRIEAFAKLVREDEREACAKICDEFCYGSTKILVEKAIRARTDHAN